MIPDKLLDDLDCQHCGERKIRTDLGFKLEHLYDVLGDAFPRIARGYRCEEADTETPWLYDAAHREGRSVTFALVDQYHRHRALRAILETFDRVAIHGTRVTCWVDDSGQPPYCLVV